MNSAEHHDTVIIGGGQSGLSMAYHLQRRGIRPLILDAYDRPGDAWRRRWDSLCLFTPSHFNGLDGLRFPGPAHRKPTKDDIADYLESYADRFGFQIRHGSRVERVQPATDGGFTIDTPNGTLHAGRVVVATGASHSPKVPGFASEIDDSITQLHSSRFRNTGQLQPGSVLIVGVGNSGADIALDVIKRHPVWLAGKESGYIPFRIESFKARYLIRVIRFMGQHVLTLRNPLGRKVMPALLGKGGPLVRIKPKDLDAAGVRRIPRIASVRDGLPVDADGETISAENIIWCTGFRHDFPWIRVDTFDEHGHPRHRRGIAEGASGLYFLGMEGLFAMTSATITGVGRDARYLARSIARSSRGNREADDRTSLPVTNLSSDARLSHG